MRDLSLGELVDLHQALLEQTGGATGIRDLGMLESAVAQPRATCGGTDLHPTLIAKAAALGFSLALNYRSSTATNVSPTPRWKCSCY